MREPSLLEYALTAVLVALGTIAAMNQLFAALVHTSR